MDRHKLGTAILSILLLAAIAGAQGPTFSRGSANKLLPNGTSGYVWTMLTSTTQGWAVGGGGSGCTSSGSAGTVQAANGSGGCQATAVTDNGTTVSTTEPVATTSTAGVATGSSPPTALTAGTSAYWGGAEGSAPTGYTTGQDWLYTNSTAHCLDTVNNNVDFGCIGAHLTNALSGNVTMTSTATFYTGPSFSMTAGTWLVDGYVSLGKASATGQNLVQCQIYDGTNYYASVETSLSYVSSAAITYTTAAMSTVAAESGSVTLSIRCQNSVGSAIIYGTTPTGSFTLASQLSAVRIQ